MLMKRGVDSRRFCFGVLLHARVVAFKDFRFQVVCLFDMLRSDAVFRCDGFVNLRENEYDRNNSKVRRYPF